MTKYRIQFVGETLEFGKNLVFVSDKFIDDLIEWIEHHRFILVTLPGGDNEKIVNTNQIETIEYA